ncbi:hypothetical protein AB0M02_38660 [Actinoplanes sp. NPDC051861]|uniref:hypothetical protein n=1 Tax=Actinoplanes sp. NPDC051861 TaxID=3155170 RepID=UPI00341EA031
MRLLLLFFGEVALLGAPDVPSWMTPDLANMIDFVEIDELVPDPGQDVVRQLLKLRGWTSSDGYVRLSGSAPHRRYLRECAGLPMAEVRPAWDRSHGSVMRAALAQVLRTVAERMGRTLEPIAFHIADVRTLRSLTSAGWEAFEPYSVAPDLTGLPMAEFLAFRCDHGAAFGRHLRLLRRHLTESVMDRDNDDHEWADRRDELAESADRLRRMARTELGAPHAWDLGIAGCVMHDDEIPGPVDGIRYAYLYMARERAHFKGDR